MVEYFVLEKTFVQGNDYTLPKDRFYVIRRIGVDQATAVYLKIDGVDTGSVTNKTAPQARLATNLLGSLDLGDLFYVVPPEKLFNVQGASGAKLRATGLIGRLAPGEACPANYLSRYAEQGRRYLMEFEGSKLYGSDYTWPDKEELEIYSLTPKTVEKYLLRKYVGAESGVSGLAYGAAGCIFYLEGVPFDILTSVPGKKGIDLRTMPRPPSTTTEMVPFNLCDLPITVLGDRTFKIVFVNVSGGNLTVAAATDQWVTGIVEFQKG